MTRIFIILYFSLHYIALSTAATKFGKFEKSRETMAKIKEQEKHQNFRKARELEMILVETKEQRVIEENTPELAKTEQIAYEEMQQGYVLGRALLMPTEHFEFEELKLLPDEMSGNKTMQQGIISEPLINGQENVFELYPNPANDYLTVNYQTSDNNSSAEIRVYDLLGKEILIQKLVNGTNILSTVQLRNGAYIYRLWINEAPDKSGKLIIKH